MKNTFRWLPLALPLLAAGCGDFPRPFQDNPGSMALRLAQPPPSHLMVGVPSQSDLPPDAAHEWAEATAEAITDAEIPSLVAEPDDHRAAWGVDLSIVAQTGTILPVYTVHDAKGKIVGTIKGDAIPPTAWVTETKAGLKKEAAKVGGQIADVLTGVEAAQQEADPNSLVNRPPKVALLGITGAPGDGDESLTKQMTLQFPHMGLVLQPKAPGSDYQVRCEVHLAPVDQQVQRIEIVWIVSDARGQEAGRVAQLHDIPAGSLDHYWGEIAAEAARQAAAGIKQVMSNQLITHRRHAS